MKLTLPEKLKPYSGVINFMIILLVSHFFWKYTVLGEDDDEIVRFFGLNISQPFIFMASHTAQVSYSLLKWWLHSAINTLPRNGYGKIH